VKSELFWNCFSYFQLSIVLQSLRMKNVVLCWINLVFLLWILIHFSSAQIPSSFLLCSTHSNRFFSSLRSTIHRFSKFSRSLNTPFQPIKITRKPLLLPIGLIFRNQLTLILKLKRKSLSKLYPSSIQLQALGHELT